LISPEQKAINKLFTTYDRAAWALQQRRDQMYPPGSLVKSSMMPDWRIQVKLGSLYPDQVLTNLGHISWRSLEKIKEQGDEKP
jgi:hypothetical protein